MRKKQYHECSVEWCDRTSDTYKIMKCSVDGKYYCNKHFQQIKKDGIIKPQYKTNEFGGTFDKEKGYTSKNELNNRIHKLWYGVLRRSNSEYYKNSHPSYKDVTMDDSWLLFSNFERDIQTLEGYELWKENTSKEYHLDKDIKIPGNKCYCKEACKFVLATENEADAMERNNPNPSQLVIGIKNDDIKIYDSARKADADGFDHKLISRACYYSKTGETKNRTKSHGGYRWYYYDDLPDDIKVKVNKLKK